MIGRRIQPFLLRTTAVAHKELLHFLRDRQAITLALGMPLVLVVLFGYAVTFDLDQVRLALVDQDRTPASRQLAQSLKASDAFQINRTLDHTGEGEPLLRRGEVKGVVVIPRGFGRRLARGENAPFQLLLDGADGTVARTTMGYTAGLTRVETLRLLRDAGLDLDRLPIEAEVRTQFNPRGRSALFIVPGLVAFVMAILAVLLTALTVAREWERGSMEQLFSTPVGRLPVVLGKLAPYVGLGFMQLLLVLAAGAWLFDLPLRGSFLLLLFATALFLVCVLGQGLLISVVTRNQQVATQIGSVSALLPSMLLSGFIFPIENMAWPLQLVSRLVPARYMISCLRSILLRGHGMEQVWPDLLAMAVLGAVIVLAATLRFKRRLD